MQPIAVTFQRDLNHWLLKYSPREWLNVSLQELAQAEAAFAQNRARAATTACKRAAGMALNAALVVEPNARWGRTYVEHLVALMDEQGVPAQVRAACHLVLSADAAEPSIVVLRTRAKDRRVAEAVRDIQAHAYAVIVRHE
jgi:hypothetical protein